jgi:hypothetical protein
MFWSQAGRLALVGEWPSRLGGENAPGCKRVEYGCAAPSFRRPRAHQSSPG